MKTAMSQQRLVMPVIRSNLENALLLWRGVYGKSGRLRKRMMAGLCMQNGQQVFSLQ